MQRTIRKVLIVRSAFWGQHEPAWYRALDQIGVDVSLFDTHSHMPRSVLGYVQQRLLAGPRIDRVNRLVLQQIRSERPDVTLFYQGQHFWSRTIARASEHTTVVGYHNDDFLGPRSHMIRFRHLRKGLHLYQGYHVYREINRREMLARGFSNCKILMSYFRPDSDYPRRLTMRKKAQFSCDLVFAGHAEDDYRARFLSMAGRSGLTVRVFGPTRYWRRYASADELASFRLSETVRGDDYRNSLCGAKIGACFLSKWNRDEYTRRVFEIPACGTFLLCERTPLMQELYEEGKEAEYFSCLEEFLDKATYYAQHDSARKRVAQAGHRRCMTSGYDIDSRMRQWLRDVELWMSQNKETKGRTGVQANAFLTRTNGIHIARPRRQECLRAITNQLKCQ